VYWVSVIAATRSMICPGEGEDGGDDGGGAIIVSSSDIELSLAEFTIAGRNLRFWERRETMQTEIYIKEKMREGQLT